MVSEAEMVIVAEMTAQFRKAEALRRAIEAAIPPTREEEGNSVFRLHEDLKMPGHFLLYERFHDQQAVDAHFGAPHFKTLMEEIASLTDGGAKITLLRRLSE